MDICQFICASTDAQSAREVEVIQSLWSGYGQILRFETQGCDFPSVIVKKIELGPQKSHPRGWNSNVSHQRKLKSYEVEMAWYQNWAQQCDKDCQIAKNYACHEDLALGQKIILLEDLDASGFPKRLNQLSKESLKASISWLAHFHAKFMNVEAKDLWAQGSYWHLATRPDELAILTDQALKGAAPLIDAKLESAQYKTLIHGDAKLANFCFSLDEKKVAAVDFQYIGTGCGMKDLAYFLSSCFQEEECEARESEVLELYFSYLQKALKTYQREVNFAKLETEWRELYAYAWTDFFRFLQGWSPGHWKIHSYSQRLAREVLAKLEKKA